jgi:hypothetical protein
MAISRMQQPRQMYGLGSLVKKAVKGVKSFAKSDLGKAAILGAGAFGLPGTGDWKGLFGRAVLWSSKRSFGQFIGTNLLQLINPFGKAGGAIQVISV